jgi:hypothetical protein
MAKKSEHELKNPESWDFDHLEVRDPVKSPRVVVSVAFPRESFNTISQYAELLGKKTSEFIREAALEKTKTRGLEMKVYDYGSTGSLWFDILPSNTRLYTIVKEQEIHETISTS